MAVACGSPLVIWQLLTNQHWVVAWLLLYANCPLLTRGGIPQKGLTAQWLQQFASSTEVSTPFFASWLCDSDGSMWFWCHCTRNVDTVFATTFQMVDSHHEKVGSMGARLYIYFGPFQTSNWKYTSWEPAVYWPSVYKVLYICCTQWTL